MTNREEITDDKALELYDEAVANGNGNRITLDRVCNTFVPRTILHAVTVHYKQGVPTEEVRAFVRAKEYVSERKWKEAQVIEKQFTQLNKKYMAALKGEGKPTSYKEQANPLKATILEGLN